MPYTYLFGWNMLQKYYYGVRYASNCSPDDLYVKYKSSSKEVKKMIKLHGKPDIIQVRRTFLTPEKAIRWEERVLRRMKVLRDEKWLNMNISGAIYIKEFTQEHKDKISKNNIGKHDPKHAHHASEVARKVNKGKKRPEHSKRIKELAKQGIYKNIYKSGKEHSWYGRNHDEETKKKMSLQKKNKPKDVCCLKCKDKTSEGLWLSHYYNHHKGCL